MVIGKGLIGSNFKSVAHLLEDVVIFSSGVSNSYEKLESNFTREKDLLLNTLNNHKNLKIIYFSSILVNNSNSPYYQHKLNMEKLIKNNSNNYLIIRLPQLIGYNGNKNTLVNGLKYSIINGIEIHIYDTIKRSIIDIDDVVNLTLHANIVIKEPATINVSGFEKLLTSEITDIMGDILGIKPKVNIMATHNQSNWEIENSKIVNDYIKFFNIKPKGYTELTLKKYLL